MNKPSKLESRTFLSFLDYRNLSLSGALTQRVRREDPEFSRSVYQSFAGEPATITFICLPPRTTTLFEDGLPCSRYLMLDYFFDV